MGRLDEDMSPVFPNDDIPCKDCIKRRSGIIGYKNSYCFGYPQGKPNEILFKGDSCELYVKEKKRK